MPLSHYSLVAWQRADDLFVRVHQLAIKQFPLYEKFELGSQLRRAAFSVAVNIVEGFARSPGPARLNFLRTSHASLAEVGYCIHVARRLAYISDDLAADLDKDIRQVGAPLAGLIRSAQAKRAAFVGVTTAVFALAIARLL